MIPFSPHQTHLPRHVFHVLIRHEIVFPRSLSAKVIVSLVSLPVDYFSLFGVMYLRFRACLAVFSWMLNLVEFSTTGCLGFALARSQASGELESFLPFILILRV